MHDIRLVCTISKAKECHKNKKKEREQNILRAAMKTDSEDFL